MLDALSLAVAYPSAPRVEAWRSGEFMETLAGALIQADEVGRLWPAYAESP